MEQQPTGTVQAVLDNHLRSFLEGRGVDAIMADYADHATLYFGKDVFRGRQQIAAFFSDFLAGVPAEAIAQFRLDFSHVGHDLAFIGWQAGPDLAVSDTLLIHGGKIQCQTVYLAPKAA